MKTLEPRFVLSLCFGAIISALPFDLCAQATSPTPPASGVNAVSSEIVILSPFEVRADNRGYQATATMSGTRLNTKLEDIASAISVVTKEQITDFALLDINDVFSYEASTEGMGNFTDFTVDRNGMVVDSAQNNPQGANRIRGMGPANITMNNFSTTGRVPVDPLSIDALEISRGPNSSIFGIGEGAGTVNLVGASANLSRSTSQAVFRADDLGGWRTSLDLNRLVIPGKLALRVSGALQHDGFRQKPSGFDSKRFNGMIRMQPFEYTSVRASYQTYRGDGNRPNTVTPRDAVSYWKSIGSPTWDPVTSTVSVNGIRTVTGGSDPAGLGHTSAQTGRPPTLFIDRDGALLWMINRMPAANATNGPNNSAGVSRLLESLPEPIRNPATRPLFSTFPGVTDKSLYDWSSINLGAANMLRDAINTTQVELEQFFLRKAGHQLAMQAGWFREKAGRYNGNVIGRSPNVGNSFYLSVDVNERLLDGQPNPYFLRPYLGVIEGNHTLDWSQRDTYRSQLAYVADFQENRGWTRWLGRHQLLGYYEFRDDRNYSYTYRRANVSVPGNPVYVTPGAIRGDGGGTVALRTYEHYYVGDNRGQNVDYGPGQVASGPTSFRWFDARSNSWTNDQVELGFAGWRTGFGSRNLVKTNGLMLQSSLLKNRLVATLGRRTDENGNKPYNQAVMNPDGIGYNIDATQQLQAVNWTKQEGDTYTRGLVAKPLRWLHLHFNRSDSFRPDVPGLNLAFEVLGNPQTVGEDYGLTLNLFDGKLAVRANRYDVETRKSRAGQAGIIATRVLRLDRGTDGFNLERQSTAWVTAANPAWTPAQVDSEVARIMAVSPRELDLLRTYPITETSDVRSKGDEIEIHYNPNSFWTTKMNVTRTNAFDNNMAPGIGVQIEKRLPIWTRVVDPRTNTLWWDTVYPGDTRSPSVYMRDSILAPLQLARATEGKKRTQVREWRVNLSTSYRLAGITEQKHLKRLSVGGAVRWEDQSAIGYYGVPIDGDMTRAVTFDQNRPIWSPAKTYVDAFLSYNTKLFADKVRARFQINARNLQESGGLQAVGVYPDGRPHTFRIRDPRSFIFTATFDL
jgi:hypothetical protein